MRPLKFKIETTVKMGRVWEYHIPLEVKPPTRLKWKPIEFECQDSSRTAAIEDHGMFFRPWIGWN